MEHIYGFTVKDTHTSEIRLNEESYQEVINLLNKKGKILDIIYENKNKKGDKCRLHIHGVVMFDRIPRFNNLFPTGYSTKIEKINCMEAWNKYISKNINQNSILMC